MIPVIFPQLFATKPEAECMETVMIQHAVFIYCADKIPWKQFSIIFFKSFCDTWVEHY